MPETPAWFSFRAACRAAGQQWPPGALVFGKGQNWSRMFVVSLCWTEDAPDTLASGPSLGQELVDDGFSASTPESIKND